MAADGSDYSIHRRGGGHLERQVEELKAQRRTSEDKMSVGMD